MLVDMEALRAMPWITESFSDPAAHIRSMISPGEKALLHWLASTWYEAKGEIVDLGCFVGADTVTLADGLEHNPARNSFPCRALIHAFDIFERAEGGDPQFISDAPLLQEYALNIEAHRKSILTYAGDITGFVWPPSRPIEILFNDVSKSPAINAHVIKSFMPYLIPGRSILIQQDYYEDHFWVPVSMEKLADYFEPFVGPLGGTRGYVFKKPIPQEILEAAGEINWREDRKHIAAVVSRHRGWYRQLFRISEARLLLDGAQWQEAQAIVDDVRTRYPDHRIIARRLARIERNLEKFTAVR